jgi:hypothetical protein
MFCAIMEISPLPKRRMKLFCLLGNGCLALITPTLFQPETVCRCCNKALWAKLTPVTRMSTEQACSGDRPSQQ